MNGGLFFSEAEARAATATEWHRILGEQFPLRYPQFAAAIDDAVAYIYATGVVDLTPKEVKIVPTGRHLKWTLLSYADKVGADDSLADSLDR